MTTRRIHLVILLLLLLPASQAMGVPLGSGETLLKSRNNQDGIAVFSPDSVRKIRVRSVDPGNLPRLFSVSPEYYYAPGEAALDSRMLRKRKTSLDMSQIFTIREPELPGRESVEFADMIRLNLFSDLEVTAVLSRIDETLSSFTWTGHINGDPGQGSASFTWADQVIIGSFNLHKKGVYTVSRQEDGLFEIRERDLSGGICPPPIVPKVPALRGKTSNPDVSYSSNGIIEIMIVWTIDAAEGAQSQGSSIQAEIAEAVSKINTTYANSNVTQRVQLVESVGTNYTASDDSLTDLTRLQNTSDGYMDEIHLLRQAEKADCVSLITNGWPGNIIGQGYALEAGNKNFFSDYAFNVVDRHYFYYQTLTHELGHNMGAGHELDNPSSPGPQFYSYSSGYHYEVDELDHWHTMMSYSHGGSYKISHFSNPEVNFEGNPTGLAGNDGNNNARTLNENMGLVDSFGEDLPDYSPNLTTCNIPGQSGFSPESVYSGETLEISITVCNYGNGPSSGFKIAYYASENPNITEHDHYLGLSSSSGINASSASSFLWAGQVPDEIPSGSYYIGWIIDADDQVNESNEDDNISFFSSPKIGIVQLQECDYYLSPSSQTYAASGGSSSFNVTSQSGCPWTAVSQASWITVSYGSSGTGNGSVVYSVSPNSSYQSRTGRIRVEDQYFIVVQDGYIPDCTITLLPESRVHNDEGGNGAFSVSTPSGCSWDAVSQNEWITIISGQAGNGDGLVSYSVDSNTGMDKRSGVILVEDASFSIQQESPYTELERQDMIVAPADFRGISPILGNSFVGMTALNLSQENKKVTFHGRNQDGNVLEVNDSLPTLSPRGQLARMTGEIIDPGPQITTIIGTGDETGLPLRGIFVLGDEETQRLDGIGHRWVPSTTLYLLNGGRSPGQVTSVFLYNPSAETAAESTLKWKDSDGNIIDTITRQIPAGGTLFQSLSQLFTTNPDASEGYIEINSSTEICGFVLAGTTESFVIFPAMPTADVDSLYIPHYVLLADGSGTEIQLINSGVIPVSIVFQVFEDQGTQQETQPLNLQPGEMLKGNLTHFVSLDSGSLEDNQVITGKMRILVTPVGEHEGFESPELIGGVILSGGEKSYAGLPLEAEGNKVTVFPHVAQSLPMRIYTGLSVWNISSQEAEVTVEAWNGQGEKTATNTFSLGTNQRRVGMLNEDFFFGSEFSQVGGHLEIRSDQNLISFCLYGDLDLEYLSTIGGQEIIGD